MYDYKIKTSSYQHHQLNLIQVNMSSKLVLMSLPDEILLQVFALFPKHLLLRLRCVSRAFALLATPGAFRSLRFRACGDEPQRFIQIATSHKLRDHVREITCDTWGYPEPNTLSLYVMGTVHSYSNFLDALRYIASFRNLDAFHLRLGTEQDEVHIIRSTVIERVFHYLAGIPLESKAHPSLPADLSTSIQLKTLTISNLDDSINTSLTKSDAFQAVTSSPRLVDLRLYLAADTISLAESSDQCSERFDLFEALPYTWLKPSIAGNLRVLSLYCLEPWGWFPKMDFRLVGAGDGMPNLEVLALGNYTFSHEWQVEWVGSLGVEKLYLDGCTVLFQASQLRGMLPDQSETVLQGSDGSVHRFSNGGYYLAPATPSSEDVAEAIHGTVRWHHLLSHWAESMSNLRVFKMGQGYWDYIPNETIDPGYYEKLHMASSEESASQPFTHHGFRYFEHPSPGTTGSGIRRYGTGASQDDSDVLKYMYWAGEYVEYDEMWENRDNERNVVTGERWQRRYKQDGFGKLTDEDRARDKAALEAMISAVDARRERMDISGARWEA